ncbi:MAG TPA: PEP-CTERM sorting domain-containing protein [Bryobacteraceae bacterium]|nr:PEP-CTERM sorting domain-containing protein [Bryobacteraceae bacterium]
MHKNILSALLMLAAAAIVCPAGIINGDFETGDFTGWTVLSTDHTGVTSGPCPNGIPITCSPHTGTFAAYFGNTVPGGVTQAVATDPTLTYTVDFWVKLFGSGIGASTPNEFQVRWDGSTLTDLVNMSDVNWEHMTFSNLSASSLSTTLAFNITDMADWIGLDDVSVSATGTAAVAPEPATLSLLAVGIALIAALRRKLKQVLFQTRSVID